MKFIPKEDQEGINSSPDHPLKEFGILLAGALSLVGVIAFFSSYISGEIAVVMGSRVESFFEKSAQQDKNLKKSAELDLLLEKVLPPSPAGLRAKLPNAYIHCDESPNAFALPGKSIWMTSGLIDSVKSEKGLAFVLAHEVGHIVNKDHLRGFGRAIGLGLVLSLIGGSENAGVLYQIPAQMTYLGLSRNTETDADTFALERIKESYGTYAGAEEFFSVMLKKDEWSEKVPTILKTHPSSSERQAKIQSLIDTENSQEKLAPHKIQHECKK